MILEKYERGTCFIETKDKDVLTIKGAVTVDVGTERVTVHKKNGLIFEINRKDLVSVWFRKETCYDFSEEGGDA